MTNNQYQYAILKQVKWKKNIVGSQMVQLP